MILGNKCDMEDKRIVSEDKGQMLALEYGIKFLETSAKVGNNIEKAFFTMARDIKAKMENKMDSQPKSGDKVNIKSSERKSGFLNKWCSVL